MDVKDIQFARPKFLRVRELHVDIDHNDFFLSNVNVGSAEPLEFHAFVFGNWQEMLTFR